MSYLQPFLLPELDNSPGIIQIRIARVDDIQLFPRAIGGKLIGDIVFQPGTGFVTWQVIHSSGSFVASSMESSEGVGKNQRVTFTLPGRSTQEIMLDLMERDRFVLYYLDTNLRPVVLGTKERPLTFRYTTGTGSIRSGRNQFDCLFFSESQDNKAEYNGAITESDPKVIIRYHNRHGEVIAELGAGESITFDGEFDYSEVILPVMSTLSGKYATIHYFKGGMPVSAQVELGKTVIVISEFTIEYTLP